MAERRSGGVLVAIGIFKMVKVTLLLVAAFAALRLLHRDPEAWLWHWIDRFNVDPTRPIVRKVLGGSEHVHEGTLWKVIITSFTYAVLMSVEGVGLILRKHWAEWATVFITGSLLPFELWELHKHVTATRIIALILNVAIVVYLVVRLVKQRHHPRSAPGLGRRAVAA
jgi:uncharacterized membrane protein (DUF2068 family)